MSDDSLRAPVAPLVLGALLILMGLVLNEWVITSIAPDGDIQSPVIRAAIWAFDIALVGVGLALVWLRPGIRWQEIALAVAATVFALLGLEAATRSGLFAVGDPGGTRRLSDSLGWVPYADFELTLPNHPVYGAVHYSTGPHGFRRFGDPSADRLKILFIGDSFTQATQVSDGSPYYDFIGQQRDDVEVFAFGGGGYGTLQEYMILDRHIDSIRPDIIVWQFTPNDIINNDHGLESRSLYNNNRMTRPYLIDGRIVHQFPSRNPLVRYSALARLVAIQLGFLEADARGGETIELAVERHEPLFDRALRTTDTLVGMIRERAGDTPIVAFATGEAYADADAFAEISARHDIMFADEVLAALDSARARGEEIDFKPYDGHWNQRGHEIVGAALLERLVGSGLLPGVTS